MANWIRLGDERPWIDPATTFPTPNKNRLSSSYATSQLAVVTK